MEDRIARCASIPVPAWPGRPDPALTARDVELRLRDARFSGRQLSTLLLDQGFLAGMGNYLRCEVLFEAAIAAGRRPASLTEDERAGAACHLDAQLP